MEEVEQERWRYTENFLKDVLKVSYEPYCLYYGARYGFPVFRFSWFGPNWNLTLGRTSSPLCSFETWACELQNPNSTAPEWAIEMDEAFKALLKTRKRGQ